MNNGVKDIGFALCIILGYRILGDRHVVEVQWGEGGDWTGCYKKKTGDSEQKRTLKMFGI